jgi:putative MATE family efflux protein
METTTKNTRSVFIQYAIPSVLGMLAVSSAAVVDGFFVGNYVGASGLAAINLAMPIFSLLFGLALMLGVGSSVVCGKLLGSGETTTASVIFSKTVIAVSVLSLLLILLIYLLLPVFFNAFGASGTLLEDTTTYVLFFLPFTPFLMVGIVLYYFVKIDNRPLFAFYALLFSAMVNILFDWLFIVYFDKGIFGAALATGISQLALFLFLIPHFFSKKHSIKFTKPKGQWFEIIKASGNGSSEFINEASIGITAIIFNYVMLHSFGVDGVAAYAVISYLIWFSFMINFGISDALQPIISKNYGANRIDRIEKLLKYAFISVFITGMIISLLLWQLPHYLAYFFLQASSSGAISIVLKFTLLIWPLFLFNGISLVVSAYFTAIHKPLPSASIAITRSLLLPVFFVLFLPLFFGDNGIYLAIPVSEFFSMFLAIGLYRRYRAKATI